MQGSATDRTDVIFGGPPPAVFSVRVDTQNFSTFSSWEPDQHLNQEITYTLYLKRASSPTAQDGIVRAWVKPSGEPETQIIDNTAAKIGDSGFHEFAAFATYNSPKALGATSDNSAEYLWDIVVWKPA